MFEVEVSIIVPVYNKEKYLEKCLESLIHQSFKNIEVICVDDGSSDNSFNILQKYSKKDSRIKIIRQDNHGPGHARNQGLKKAMGKYVAFIDADDWVELDTIEILYHNAIQNNSDLVLFNAIEYLPNDKTRRRIYYKNDINGTFNFHQRKGIVMNSYLIVCTKLHNLDFIMDNEITFSDSGLFEDVFFHVKSMIKAEKVSYVNKILYNYRRTEINTRQSNSTKSKKSLAFMDVLENIKTLLIEEGIYKELEVNYHNFKLKELKNLYNNSDEKEKFGKVLKNDFVTNPISDEVFVELSIDRQEFYKTINESYNITEFKSSSNNHIFSFFSKYVDSIKKKILK